MPHVEKPNILLITAHDLGDYLGCYGTPVSSPNLDALAKQGFGRDRPLVTGFVALEEGPTVPARIESDGRAVEVGMAVEAEFLIDEEFQPQPATLIFRAI